jgi:DNA-binding LytR/AlgR family response regulator
MIYIAICDDDALDIQSLEKHLAKLSEYDLSAKILTYQDPTELVEDIRRGYRFNLIFMDMLMKPINGIDASMKIRQYDQAVPLVIVTATSEFAVDGYKVEALRYLIKPIKEEELLKVVVPILQKNKFLNQQFFTFQGAEGLTRLPVGDIYYFQSDLRDIKVVSTEGASIFTGKISEIADNMDKFDFVRTHKSYVVNLHKIETLNAQELTLSNGEHLPVSKHRYKDIMLRYLDIVNPEIEGFV